MILCNLINRAQRGRIISFDCMAVLLLAQYAVGRLCCKGMYWFIFTWLPVQTSQVLFCRVSLFQPDSPCPVLLYGDILFQVCKFTFDFEFHQSSFAHFFFQPLEALLKGSLAFSTWTAACILSLSLSIRGLAKSAHHPSIQMTEDMKQYWFQY